MSPTDTKTAVQAARAAVWTWSSENETLAIQADGIDALKELDGQWRFSEFLDQLDGLARNGAERAIRSPEMGQSIDHVFTLKSGSSARLIGASLDSGMSRGLIFSLSAPRRETHALDIDLEPVYQPIVHAKTGAIAGFEALARWRNADGDLLSPEDLTTGKASPNWLEIAPLMINEAARALSEFRKTGGDYFMQVNLSAAEIARGAIVQETEAAIKKSGLPQDALRLELTEQAALRDKDRGLAALASFRAAGAALVLDDFGAGHSSLAWLADIPADGIKLDAELTAIVNRPRGRTILSALIRLAKDLGMRITAEGVETREQADALSALGCTYLQGYYYAEPMPFLKVEQHLTDE